MNLWQIAGIEKATAVLRTVLDPESIEITGSMLTLESVDIFSDVDLSVLLKDAYIFDIDVLISALENKICAALGYEVHNHENYNVLRICFENSWRFDITIKHRLTKPSSDKNDFRYNVEKIINEFWFKASMALMKIGRNDFLIAAHLALELCQLNIVMKMLERDNEKNTNIHRFGEKELAFMPSCSHVGVPISLDNETANDILRIIFHASEYMDMTSAKLIKEYCSRSDSLKNICRTYFE